VGGRRLAVGVVRLGAIDRGAFRPIGRPTTARGFVTAVRADRGARCGRGSRPPTAASGSSFEPVPTFRSVGRWRPPAPSRARALGGRLPGAPRHPPGARRRSTPAHRRAPGGPPG
jgi:hypothetical protein